MLSVQMAPPSFAAFQWMWGSAICGMSPDHDIAAEMSPFASDAAYSLPVNARICPLSAAFLIRLMAALNDLSVTFAGSSPFESITSVSASPISLRTVILPFSFGFSSKSSIDRTGSVSLSL